MRRVLILITFLLILISTPSQSAQKSGWIKRNSYFKPFVLVYSPKGKLVLFITPEGRVYRGKCRKSSLNREFCRISPGKKFYSKEPLRYVVLQLGSGAPQVVETGVIY